MKKILYSALIILAACSPHNKTETEVDNKKVAKKQTDTTISASAPTPHQIEENGSGTVKMIGKVHFSFEQAEFTTSEKTFFIISGYSLIRNVEAKREHSGAYNVTLHNVCINGRILTKAQNNGNGFGPLGRYNQAVAVESLC
ncbi:hypothetical protein [Neisseria dentiae]|uniref:hypothetical protein n=1 Tax=Neisseria dentiae TaxID=194197 RepID=UPI00359F750F